jgi:hypothetical protein
VNRRTAGLALLADLAAVTVFAAVGRSSHAEGITAAGVVETAAPFAAGTLAGWALVRGWGAPTSLRRTGIGVWLTTVVVGMLLRRASGEGTAPSFVVVATSFLGLTTLGWRGVAALAARRRLHAS